MPLAMKIVGVLAAFVLTLLAGGPAVLAHEGESGEDVGYAYLKATEADGLMVVELEVLAPDPCDVFEPGSIIGQRGETSVSAPLVSAGPCRFHGVIELPEPGRWMIAARLTLDDRQVEASILAGVADSTAVFERETWIHTIQSDGSESSFLAGDLLSYALYGAGAAALTILLAYAALRSRRHPEGTRPTAIP